MSENAKGRNHPQSPRKRIALRIGTGRGRQARGYDNVNKVWTHSKKKTSKTFTRSIVLTTTRGASQWPK